MHNNWYLSVIIIPFLFSTSNQYCFWNIPPNMEYDGTCIHSSKYQQQLTNVTVSHILSYIHKILISWDWDAVPSEHNRAHRWVLIKGCSELDWAFWYDSGLSTMCLYKMKRTDTKLVRLKCVTFVYLPVFCECFLLLCDIYIFRT